MLHADNSQAKAAVTDETISLYTLPEYTVLPRSLQRNIISNDTSTAISTLFEMNYYRVKFSVISELLVCVLCNAGIAIKHLKTVCFEQYKTSAFINNQSRFPIIIPEMHR